MLCRLWSASTPEHISCRDLPKLILIQAVQLPKQDCPAEKSSAGLYKTTWDHWLRRQWDFSARKSLWWKWTDKLPQNTHSARLSYELPRTILDHFRYFFPFLRSLPYTSLLPPLVTSFFLSSLWWGVAIIPCCMHPIPSQCWHSSQGTFYHTTQNQTCLQWSWIWFPHSTFEYCLTVKRSPQRWQFMYRQAISEKDIGT